MSTPQANATGPDLTLGIPADDLPDGGMRAGHVGDEAVLLARTGEEVFAIGATCSHYGGPLVDGLMVEDTVRCPWHHACFSLRTGEALHAPAFAPVACWAVEQRNGRIFVTAKRQAAIPAKAVRTAPGARSPSRIVIIGGGAAGFAAAVTLRRHQYDGSIIMLSSDDAPPVDRPNLSKDYLAGNAPEEWVPLRPDGFYAENGIDLRLKAEVVDLNLRTREVGLAGGEKIAYDRLLLATGAEPIRLSIPGGDQPHVCLLRSIADCRAIIERTKTSERAVVLGASFIGLEVAAALRARGLEVHVVAPEERPMERILGPQMGDFIRSLHSERGIVFHLEDVASAITGQTVELRSGGAIPADLVVAGIGVRPRLAVAEHAGLTTDRGLVVDAYLETGIPGVFAAGDIARWPDPRSGTTIRVEHWAVAERQGQTAAVNMLGHNEKFTAVPFFWSQHYEVAINYVGHAESWDAVEIEGSVDAKDCLLRYRRNGRIQAVASINRDLDSLKAELIMEPQTAVSTARVPQGEALSSR